MRKLAILCGCLVMLTGAVSAEEGVFPGTKKLTMEGDITAQLVEGADRFLLRQTEESTAKRAAHWERDLSSAAAYSASIADNRKQLAHILGLRDARPAFGAPELIATTDRPALVGESKTVKIYAVRWPCVEGVSAEGLLLVPRGRAPIADCIALCDADQTPEMIAGLTDDLDPTAAFALQLAEAGCRVLAPAPVNRTLVKRRGRANVSNREWIYRLSFNLGRHIIGYELNDVLAGVDWMTKEQPDAKRPIAVVGYGEGGMLAQYAAAVDTRIDAAVVSGFFGSCDTIWKQGSDRNVFGLLKQFGDAELAAMIAPRPLIIEASSAPDVTLPSEGGAPGRIETPSWEHVQAEADRAKKLVEGLSPKEWLTVTGKGKGPFGRRETLQALLNALAEGAKLPEQTAKVSAVGPPRDLAARLQQRIAQLERHTQRTLVGSAYVRNDFMKKLDRSSLERYAATVEPYREFFRDEVIGSFDLERLPPNVRTRVAYNEEKWIGYEVVMDVFPDVIAYGVLLMPKDIKPGEKRPVVVCQHGLEGRPEDTFTGDHRAYHDFAAKLCERGFITFAPQNLYIGKDKFRTLQRKANPLKTSLFSIIVPQHQQITDWLASLPQVDSERIGFYGLSYGGKSAMRIPPLVDNYCLSICSADFNEWVWKNVSIRAPMSYVWTGEYEIFEFDLGSTFNYAEMAALICPRPFMVERGHFDGVAPDETVGYEFAKIRHLYQAKLGIGDRTEIEWFVGPHTINGKGTFDFLHRHLRWEKK